MGIGVAKIKTLKTKLTYFYLLTAYDGIHNSLALLLFAIPGNLGG